MAKAASPVRLQQDLMDAAAAAGERYHRSAAEQIEYWAAIGRSVGKLVDPDALLAVTSGLARLKIEPVIAASLNPDEVFASLERDRDSGVLAAAVAGSAIAGNGVRYQASSAHPGLLEQIAPDGRIVLGQFHNGVFTAMADRLS